MRHQFNDTFFTFDDREEWLAWRKLGASDAAVIMGQSPYKTPLMLWKEKLGITAEPSSNSFMEYGKQREAHILQKLRERYGWEIHEQLCCSSLPDPFLTATLDGYVKNADAEGSLIIEVKAPQMKAWEEFKASGFKVPIQYLWQMQHQMLLSGVHRCLYAVECYNTGELHLQFVTYDYEAISMYLPYVFDFWEKVKTKTPPKTSLLKGKAEPAFLGFHLDYTVWKDELEPLLSEEASLNERLKIIAKRKKEMGLEILKKTHEKGANIGSYRVREVFVAGSIDWKAVATHYTKDQTVDWEAFTKAPLTKIVWTSSKEEEDV